MKTYVYTKKAEVHARKLQLEERKEGVLAMYGKKPVYFYGSISAAWLDMGYIKEAEK